MKFISVAIALLVVTSGWQSYAEPNTPPAPLPIASFDGSLNATCDIVEKLRDEENRTDYVKNFSDSPVYMSYTPDMQAYVLDVKDFTRNYIELLEVRNHITAKSFRERITTKALNRAIERKKDYYMVMKTRRGNDTHKSEKKLNACLQKKGYSNSFQVNKEALAQTYDKDKLNSFLAETLENSVRAWLLFDRKEMLKQKMTRDLEIAVQEKESLNSQQRKKFTGDKDVISRYGKLIGDIDTQLNILYSESGPIFKTENDMSLSKLSVFNHVLVPSTYMRHILKLFTNDELLEIRRQVGDDINKELVTIALLEVADIKRIDDYLVKNKDKVSDLQKRLLRSIADHIDEINEAAISVCEQNGAELHHFDEFVRNVLDEHLTSRHAANLLYKDVGAYCHLKEIEPHKEANFFNWRNMTGTGLLLVGGGIKWIAKTSFWGTLGGAMMWGGEGLLAYEAYKNFMIHSAKKGNSYLMANGGWISYVNHTENIDEAKKFLAEMVVAPVGAGLALWPGVVGVNKSIPYIASRMNKERVTKRTLGVSTTRIGAAKYFQNLLKRKQYKAYQRGIKLRYDYFQNNADFQLKRRKLELRKEYFKAGTEVNLGFKTFNLKTPNGISALHRNTEHGRDAILTIDRFNGPKPDANNIEAIKEWERSHLKAASWLNYFDDPMKNVYKILDVGATADAQLPVLKNIIREADAKTFLDPSRPGETKIINFELPKVVDGLVSETPVSQPFDSYSDLKAYYEKMRDIANRTFAKTPARELARDSDIYRELDNWAWEYRRLQFLHSELRLNSARNPLQEEVFQRATEILETPGLRPRGDSRVNLLSQEIRAEIGDLVTTAKSKSNVFKNEFQKLSKEAQDRIKDATVFGMFRQHLLKVVTIPTIIVGERYYRSFQAQGATAQMQAKFNYWLRNTVRGGRFDYSMDEILCAAEGRSFSFMLCYNSEAKKELAVEYAESVDKPTSYIVANDKEIKNKLRNYAYKMIYLRRKFRGSELFHLSDYILNTAYSDFSKAEFARLIDLKNPDKPELSTRVLEILSSSTKEEALETLAKFEKDYEGLYIDSIKAFIANPGSMTASIKEGLRLPRRIENDLRGIVFIEDYDKVGALGEEFNSLTGHLIDELGIGNFLGMNNPQEIIVEKEQLDEVLEENGTDREEVTEELRERKKKEEEMIRKQQSDSSL